MANVEGYNEKVKRSRRNVALCLVFGNAASAYTYSVDVELRGFLRRRSSWKGYAMD